MTVWVHRHDLPVWPVRYRIRYVQFVRCGRLSPGSGFVSRVAFNYWRRFCPKGVIRWRPRRRARHFPRDLVNRHRPGKDVFSRLGPVSWRILSSPLVVHRLSGRPLDVANFRWPLWPIGVVLVDWRPRFLWVLWRDCLCSMLDDHIVGLAVVAIA